MITIIPAVIGLTIMVVNYVGDLFHESRGR
jgi:hypothetical protein